MNESPLFPGKMIENLKLAWNGFQLVLNKIQPMLDGTPAKLPVAVLSAVINVGNVS